MKRILLTITALTLLASFGYCRDSTQLSRQPDQISTEELTGYIKTRDAVTERPLDEAGLNAFIAKGRKIFQKGRFLPEKFKEEFLARAVGSRGEGVDKIYLFNFLNKTIDENQKIWDRYPVVVTLEFDGAGRVADFYWDKPMLSADRIINAEQLGIFLRYAQQKSFHSMRNKGYELFRKGRVLSKEYAGLFAKYLKDDKDGIVRYEFYSYSDSSPRVMSVYLDVGTKDGKIINFAGIEGW